MVFQNKTLFALFKLRDFTKFSNDVQVYMETHVVNNVDVGPDSLSKQTKSHYSATQGYSASLCAHINTIRNVAVGPYICVFATADWPSAVRRTA